VRTFLLSRQWEPGAGGRDGFQEVREYFGQSFLEDMKISRFGDFFLIHVKPPVDFDLDGMTVLCRATIGLGNIAASIWFIAGGVETGAGEKTFKQVDKFSAAGGAVAIPKDDVGAFVARFQQATGA